MSAMILRVYVSSVAAAESLNIMLEEEAVESVHSVIGCVVRTSRIVVARRFERQCSVMCGQA